ncbi:MAG: sensor histidine kinase, partial [Candidatus Binataceae bacterium]
MPEESEIVFDRGAWSPALEKYAAVVHLTVQLYNSSGSLVCGPVCPFPLFETVARNGFPREFAECARRCLGQTSDSPEIVIETRDGITVLGAPLRLDHKIVGAAVAGYALRKFHDRLAIGRFSREHRLSADELWNVCRAISPEREEQLKMRGELLRVLGESILREQARTRESERLYEESRKANRAKDEFISVLSHELRTPLNAIVGSVAVARIKKNQAGIVSRSLDTIDRNARAQVRVIEDLLDISRIVTGKLRMEVAPVDLFRLIRESLETIRPAADAKAITLDEEIDASAGVVFGDQTRLQQVLWNLVSNAVKFTPANGRVRVMVRRAGGTG